MAHRDAGATGSTTAPGPKRNPSEKWSASGLGGGIVPVVSGTTTYANSYALRTTDRDGIWTAEMDTAPTVAGTTLYTTRGSRVVALNRRDGSEQWSFSPDGYYDELQPERPVLYDGSLYVPYMTGFEDGYLYAIDASDGSVEWEEKAFVGEPSAPVAVSEDRVFVSGDRGGNGEPSLKSFDRSDGTQQWSQPEAATSRQPVYRDGVVYNPGTEAVDTTTGAIRWTFEASGRPFLTTVAVSDETLVAVSSDGSEGETDAMVYGLALDGTERWTFEADAVSTSPAIADGVAYIGPTAEGVVYALDETTGEELWNFDVGTQGAGTSLAVANGVLYAPTADGALYAIEEGENEPPTPSIEFYPTDPVVGEPVSFDGTGSTDDTGITGFAWSVSGPIIYEATGPRASTAFSEPGEYEVALSVTDENGASATTSESFSVRPEPTATETATETTTEARESETETEANSATGVTETTTRSTTSEVTASFSYAPTDPPVGETVEFDASGASSTTGEILAYEWNFDDGSTGAGRQVSHSFDEVGHFFVELTVTDSAGNTDSTETEVRTVRGGAAGAGPGFGLGSALASLGGVGYLLRRRLGDDE